MTEAEKFECVLAELGQLLLSLGDLAEHVVLIGGQVLALEARQKTGDATIQVVTDTGITVPRGYSFEPDLLFDFEQQPQQAERLPQILGAAGYKRTREHRWAKQVGEVAVEIDLFVPDDIDDAVVPTGATRLPQGALALARPQRLAVKLKDRELPLQVPSPAAFLALKLDAKLIHRPGETKDCFDIFAYVRLHTPKVVGPALDAVHEGRAIRRDLYTLFGDVESPGVLDVLKYAATLDQQDQALLARSVVDLFAELASEP
ncbi:MAG: hypothetical protein JST54_26600 [Deltaproteobacteria bacterium]|nr:hypothetical protein [Deltaproteobacteria bacterium]